MAEMFKTTAIRHGVTENEVRESITDRPAELDLLVMLSFAALYAFVAHLIARRSSMIMNAYVSVVLSAVPWCWVRLIGALA